MKMRFLGLAVTLVALAVMVNALALKSATINGTTVSIPIVNSSAALIAIGGATVSPDPDVIVTDSGGVATISVQDGLQPNSSYSFGNVLTITNNSETDVTLSISVGDLTGTGINAITFYDSATSTAFTSGSLAKNTSITLTMSIDVSATAPLGTKTPAITVSATTP